MIANEGTRTRGVGFLLSFASHLAVAAIVVSVGAQRSDAVSAPSKSAAAVPARFQPSLTPPPLRVRARDSARAQAMALIPRLDEDSRMPSDTSGWFNHLLQSTVFAMVAGQLAMLFRRNGAHIRYWVWFGASVKFLVLGLIRFSGRFH
jgi:hypothetical protein